MVLLLSVLNWKDRSAESSALVLFFIYGFSFNIICDQFPAINAKCNYSGLKRGMKFKLTKKKKWFNEFECNTTSRFKRSRFKLSMSGIRVICNKQFSFSSEFWILLQTIQQIVKVPMNSITCQSNNVHVLSCWPFTSHLGAIFRPGRQMNGNFQGI